MYYIIHILKYMLSRNLRNVQPGVPSTHAVFSFPGQFLDSMPQLRDLNQQSGFVPKLLLSTL